MFGVVLFFFGPFYNTPLHVMIYPPPAPPPTRTQGNYHYWPLGMAADDCHGWAAYADADEKMHENAANNIRFSADGTKLLYDQYAGNLDCSGTATSKEFELGACHQGIPPTLYDTLVNNDCADVTSEACVVGVPRVESDATSDEKIYKNGELCDAASADTGAGEAATDAAATAANCCADGSAPVSDGDHTTPPCADESSPTNTCTETDATDAPATAATVTWVVYTDDACTQLHANCESYGCATTLTVGDTCQQWTEASADAVTCTDSKITYNNYPNTGTTYEGATACDPSKIKENELEVGVCQYFPGPVPTWKKIDASTHSCGGTDVTDAPATDAPATDAPATDATEEGANSATTLQAAVSSLVAVIPVYLL